MTQRKAMGINDHAATYSAIDMATHNKLDRIIELLTIIAESAPPTLAPKTDDASVVDQD